MIRDRKAVPLGAWVSPAIEHILLGWDHLLFVLTLVLLVGWGRSLLWKITAFTAGHSVTLALVARAVPAYGIGTMAAFWFLQRAVALL